MKIKIANTYEFNLDQSFSQEERLDYINSLLETVITLDNLTTTIEDYFRETWNKNNTKVALDIIGYYLSKSNTNSKQDNDIISRRKFREMVKWNDKYETFSDLSEENKVLFGFEDDK